MDNSLIKDHYVVFHLGTNEFYGFVIGDEIFNIGQDYIAYKLNSFELERINKMVIKKLKDASFSSKIKMLLGWFK